jgi:hypothetical protein
MPIVATPAAAVVVTVEQVRRFMRDYPDKNILLEDVEFTQEEVNQALDLATSAWNSIPPLLYITTTTWPAGTEYLLLLGTAWNLLLGGTFTQLRNQATYQDGDIAPIGIDDKFPLYQSFGQQLRSEWWQQVQQVKAALNLQAAYGSLSSGYRWVSRYGG